MLVWGKGTGFSGTGSKEYRGVRARCSDCINRYGACVEGSNTCARAILLVLRGVAVVLT